MIRQLLGLVLTFVGGTIRYVYGTIWRTLFNKRKYTFNEYMNGPDRASWYDTSGHGFVNYVIGILAFLLFFLIIMRH
jgi:hypothetical protein